jgi:hypothetical protein
MSGGLPWKRYVQTAYYGYNLLNMLELNAAVFYFHLGTASSNMVHLWCDLSWSLILNSCVSV